MGNFRAFVNLANLFTLTRVALTPFVVLAVLDGRYRLALWLGIGAGVTDTLDGLLARATSQVTRVGAYLDPAADKLLLSAGYIALGASGLIAWWMVGLVFGRDIFILAMVAYGYTRTEIRDFPPSLWGKLSTVAQITAAMAVVNDKAGSSLPSTPFLWAMVALTAWSGIHYGWRGWTMLKSVSSRRKCAESG